MNLHLYICVPVINGEISIDKPFVLCDINSLIYIDEELYILELKIEDGEFYLFEYTD